MAEPQQCPLVDLREIAQELEDNGDLVESDCEKLLSHIAWLDAEIERLEQSLTEARGVAAQLLNGMPHDRAAWLNDFPWLTEYTR